MNVSDGKLTECCVFWAIVVVLGCAMLALDTLIGQWLLGLFGWHFGFWRTLGIIMALHFILGGITVRVRR